MELSISTGLYYKLEYKSILELISKTGFTSIELMLNQAFDNVSISDIATAISANDLKVASIHTPLEFIAFQRKETEEYWIDKSIKIAEVLNARLINTHMVLGENFENPEIKLDQVHKKNLLKYCNNVDKIITTENIPAYTENELLGNIDNFIELVTKNNIPITFDTTHCLASGLPLIDTFERVKGLVKNIHLSNFEDGNEHKLLENGEIDIAQFIKYLHSIENKGFITLEFDFDNPKRNQIVDLQDAENKLREQYRFISSLVL